jgi:hypothetical protein
METLAGIIAAFGGKEAFGRLLGATNYSAAWKRGDDILRKGSIPVHHWPLVIEEAKKIGLKIDANHLLYLQTGYTPQPAPPKRPKFSLANLLKGHPA